MAYNIVNKKSVQRDLKKLSINEARQVLKHVEEKLSKNAETYPVLKVQFAGLRKHSVGEYKVICAILGDDVLVHRIGRRKDVY